MHVQSRQQRQNAVRSITSGGAGGGGKAGLVITDYTLGGGKPTYGSFGWTRLLLIGFPLLPGFWLRTIASNMTG